MFLEAVASLGLVVSLSQSESQSESQSVSHLLAKIEKEFSKGSISESRKL